MDPLKQLLGFSEKIKKIKSIGRLIGIELPARDQFIKESFETLEKSLADAKEKAAKDNETIFVDSTEASSSVAEDFYTVDRNGKIDRVLGKFSGFDSFLQNRQNLTFKNDSNIDRENLLTAAFNGLWSPSATNWQPMRVIEVNASSIKHLDGFKNVSIDDSATALVFLRRIIYESLLEDVLEPFGFHVNAKEELIDWGIFSEVFKMSIESKGGCCLTGDISSTEVSAIKDMLLAEFSKKIDYLKKEDGTLCDKELNKVKGITGWLESGKYYPAEVVIVGSSASDQEKALYDKFDTVVLSRSSERVASSTKKMPESDILKIIESSTSSFSDYERSCFKVVYFDKDNIVPNRIGQSMFYALYGDGADLETRKGGTNGFVPGMNVKNFLSVLLKKFPEDLKEFTPDTLNRTDDKILRKFARTFPVKEKYLGSHILDRITRDGKYLIKDGDIINAKGSPLSSLLLVRIMANLAQNFGNFFLKFQNTHPYTLIFLAKTSDDFDETSRTYNLIGRAVSIMALHSRSMGLSGVVKTGPIDVAREKIKESITEYMLSNEETVELGNDLQKGRFKPALFYQVGFPLAGDDIVDEGEESEHSGFEERKRDKRPPRADSTDHYLPLL